MRAVVCDAFGPIEQLVVRDIAPPPLTGDGVRLRVRCASLNGPDLLMPSGTYQVRPDPPFVPGLEAMGEVLECGPAVHDLSPGDRVMTYAGQGAFAEEMVAPRAAVFRVPDGMDDTAAAGFTLVYGTAYHGLVDCGRLRAGETVLIIGAAGGVGMAAIQIAKALGATVIAVASTQDKRQACRAEGADLVLAPEELRIRGRIHEAAGAGGVQVVLDPVGGDLAEPVLRAIAPYGRYLIAGYASRSIPLIKGNLVLLKQAQVIGVSYRLMAERDCAWAARNLKALCELHEAGRLRPRTSATYALDDIVAALQALDRRETIGKVAIAVAQRG